MNDKTKLLLIALAINLFALGLAIHDLLLCAGYVCRG